mmetsp:Transcript_22304/g.33472  ORF Transcript_22304/g.33472 Transcript_22304/m.33472 type:complete len:111 (-) Transcript_22304:508-840(-)|eukprot:CAMPEP_0116026764 /NCGR_PEP_ID=MMETSP0321-20121206/14103_1 /TAXON_ID=163516 /ORGANISM="Leptocylindrus danicus var. danicus, Strain B650" /LENGTH=110 /DNA_ID=CAMNT_0003499741 /DNA_START=235 /DNA_END=567 /DNA_ORIENTATION=+
METTNITSPTTTATDVDECKHYSDDNKENWDPNLKIMHGVGGVSSKSKAALCSSSNAENHVVVLSKRQKSHDPLNHHHHHNLKITNVGVPSYEQRRPLTDVARKNLMNMR